MAKKNITLNDLGIMIKQGFDDNDKRFDGIDKRFDGVDKRFSDVDKSIKELKKDMEEVKLKFAYTAWAIDVEELKKRVLMLEKKLGVK